MNSISLDSFHSEFQLNNIAFDIHSLLQKVDLFIEKGADFEKQMGFFLKEWFDDSDHITAQSSGTTGIPKRSKFLNKPWWNRLVLRVFFLI